MGKLYSSKNVGPQEGEATFDDEDEEEPRGTHWICRCHKRNRMERENCFNCGRSKDQRIGSAFVDGSDQDKDEGDRDGSLEDLFFEDTPFRTKHQA